LALSGPTYILDSGQLPSTVIGDRRLSICTVTFDNSYPTGGLSFKPSDVQFQTIDALDGNVLAPAGSVTAVVYDRANNKLKAFTAAAEVANATNLSALTVQLFVVGR
jgi:hypothetical protein